MCSHDTLCFGLVTLGSIVLPMAPTADHALLDHVLRSLPIPSALHLLVSTFDFFFLNFVLCFLLFCKAAELLLSCLGTASRYF